MADTVIFFCVVTDCSPSMKSLLRIYLTQVPRLSLSTWCEKNTNIIWCFRHLDILLYYTTPLRILGWCCFCVVYFVYWYMIPGNQVPNTAVVQCWWCSTSVITTWYPRSTAVSWFFLFCFWTCLMYWCTTQLAKLSFNHSNGRTHSWRFSTFFKIPRRGWLIIKLIKLPHFHV